jgi:hypothetical protein
MRSISFHRAVEIFAMETSKSNYMPRYLSATTLALLVVLGACSSQTPAQEDNKETQSGKQSGTEAVVSHPYSPKPEDEKLTRGTVAIDAVTGAAAQAAGEIVLSITGTLPTPCHELRLRIPATVSTDGLIRIEAWSVTDPDRLCAQVLQPFSVQVPVRAAAGAKIEINGKTYDSIRP